MYETVIWASDGFAEADAALAEALSLVERSGGHLIAVHCDHRLHARGRGLPALADEDDRRRKIQRQVAGLQNDGVDVELVIRRGYDEAAYIVAAVATTRNADVIVCGARGFGPFSGAFLGSFTQRLIHVAPCPVLIVPERVRVGTSARCDQVEVGA